MYVLNSNETRPAIYICQFATGFSKNLMPLAAGRLHSVLRKAPEVKANYCMGEILFLRQDPVKIVAEMKNPAIVAFSTYMWNWELSLAVAQLLKQVSPKIVTVFGGPSVPNVEEQIKPFFSRYDCVDILCHSDEISIREIALAYLGSSEPDLSHIKGISYRSHDKQDYVYTGTRPFVQDLAAIPSPFLDGTFTELYERHTDHFSGVIWETNRGCPFSCTFCNWGSAIGQQVRTFDMDVLRAELDWMGKNGISYISCADANYGIKKRDREIAEALVETRQEYGNPRYLSVSWVKNSSPKVLDIAKVLRDGGIGFKVGLSLQSTNEAVLRAVKRSNIKLSTYRELKEIFSKEDMPTFSEFILGLPEETYESFLAGIEESFTNSLDDHIFVYLASILENTELALPEQMREHQIQTKRIPFGFYRTAGAEKVVGEYEDVVIGTKTMPVEKWQATYKASFFALALYDHRSYFIPLMYLRNEYNVPVTGFSEFCLAMGGSGKYYFLSNAIKYLDARIDGILNNNSNHLKIIPGFDEGHWTPSESVYLLALAMRIQFFDEMDRLLPQYLKQRGVEVDDAVLADLMKTQRHFLAHWDGPPSSTVVLRYDVPDYVEQMSQGNRVPLIEGSLTYEIQDMLPSYGNRDLFIKQYLDVRGSRVFNAISTVKNDRRVTYFAPNIVHAVGE